jgi:hypothetical protein
MVSILKLHVLKKAVSYRIKKAILFGPTAGKGKVHGSVSFSKLLKVSLWRRRIEVGKFFKKVKKDDLEGLYLFSLSRSGSHLFAAQLHYHPRIFVFAEQLFNKTDNRQPYSGLPNKLHPVDFLFGSCFRENGIQLKDPKKLSTVGFMYNKYREDTLGNCITASDGVSKPKFVFYLRNPFRTAISRFLFAKKSKRQGKKWDLDKTNFILFMQSFAELVKKSIETKNNNEKAAFVIFHEIFCLNSQEICREVFKFLKFNDREIEFDPNPKLFFNKCFWSNGQLVERNKKLVCEKTGQEVYGAGGNFNPIMPPNLERTMNAEVRSFITPELLDESYRILPERAVDFFLNDGVQSYNSLSNNKLFNFIFEEWISQSG